MIEAISKLRLMVVFLVFLGLASPIIGPAISVGAQATTCEDFETQADAQEAMDDDPDLAEELDQDGDGEACNEDGNVTAEDVSLPEDEDETATAEADDEETPTADDEDNGGSNDADAEQYLADVQDEVDSLQGDVDRFLEVNELGEDATDDDYADLLAIAENWAEYDDVASELVAPDGLEDVDASYQDLAGYTVTSGELWVEAEAALADGDQDVYDETLSKFNDDGFIPMQDELDTLQGLLDDAGSGGGGNGGSNEDGDAYLESITSEVTGITDSIDNFNTALETAGDESATEADQQDAIDEITQIAEDWAAYPDVAAEIEAPEGFEDIDAAYQDFAAEVGDMGTNWQTYFESESGSDEETEAQDAFVANMENVQAQAEDLNTMIEDASGGSSSDDGNADDGGADDGNEDPTPTEESGNGGDADTEEYLATVQDNYDELSTSVERFNELLANADSLTDDDLQEVIDIIDLWANASGVAQDLDVPDGVEDVQAAYEDYTGALGDAADAFGVLGDPDATSAEQDQAGTDFADALSAAESSGADLEDALAEAGS